MKPFLVILPFHSGDFQLGLDLLGWIGELGGAKEYPLLLLASKRALNIETGRMAQAASNVFGEVFLERAPGLDDEKWPRGANVMFRRACELVHTRFKLPFLWLEPDCVPMKSGWLNAICAEYMTCGKPFMGNVRTQTTNPNLPQTYLPGCSVYPSNALSLLAEKMQRLEVAWDVSTAEVTVPHAHRSRLFYEWWGIKGIPPMFKAVREKGDPENVMVPSQIPKEAALFHRCKDGNLIRILRPKPLRTKTGINPKSTPNQRIIHVVERHSAPGDARIARAVDSWKQLYLSGELVPFEVWNYPRSSADLGDKRNMPFLKDLLILGMQEAKPDDIILLTNGDSLLYPTLPKLIRETLSRFSCICSGRLNVSNPIELSKPIDELTKNTTRDLGRDLFAFRKCWLIAHWGEIPDFLVGECEWDLVLALLIRKENGVHTANKDDLAVFDPCSELPLGYLYHESHNRVWMAKENLTSPAKRHNIELANDWYSKRALASHVINL